MPSLITPLTIKRGVKLTRSVDSPHYLRQQEHVAAIYAVASALGFHDDEVKLVGTPTVDGRYGGVSYDTSDLSNAARHLEAILLSKTLGEDHEVVVEAPNGGGVRTRYVDGLFADQTRPKIKRYRTLALAHKPAKLGEERYFFGAAAQPLEPVDEYDIEEAFDKIGLPLRLVGVAEWPECYPGDGDATYCVAENVSILTSAANDINRDAFNPYRSGLAGHGFGSNPLGGGVSGGGAMPGSPMVLLGGGGGSGFVVGAMSSGGGGAVASPLQPWVGAESAAAGCGVEPIQWKSTTNFPVLGSNLNAPVDLAYHFIPTTNSQGRQVFVPYLTAFVDLNGLRPMLEQKIQELAPAGDCQNRYRYNNDVAITINTGMLNAAGSITKEMWTCIDHDWVCFNPLPKKCRNVIKTKIGRHVIHGAIQAQLVPLDNRRLRVNISGHASSQSEFQVPAVPTVPGQTPRDFSGAAVGFVQEGNRLGVRATTRVGQATKRGTTCEIREILASGVQ